MFLFLRKKIKRLVDSILLILYLMLMTVFNVRAENDVTLTCKTPFNQTVLDMKTLNIIMSKEMPVGTVVYSGIATTELKCAMSNIFQFADKLTGEVYIKPQVIPDNILGYGLSIYIGDAGKTGAIENIPTGKIISTYAHTSGGTLGKFTDITLNVPFQIVRTSNSMEPPKSLRNDVHIFSVGSLVPGRDEDFYFTNIKNGGIVAKDKTCSVAGNSVLPVPLGDYAINRSSGLGSGIGQTSPEKAFSIKLNCEALLSGKFDVAIQLDGDASNGLSEMGVLALNTTSTASGVGVQILNENKEPVKLATPFKIAAYPISSALVTVPLYARYYQTANTVGPGTANAVATYTISYQ